jgi:glycerol-3-phosphate dehydrogenase (NAD(P)+)
LRDADLIVSVVPSHALKQVLENAADIIPSKAIIVSCTKGLETSTGKLISEILEEALPNVEPGRMTFLSGPSFAIEVAKDLPTLVVIAGTDQKNAEFVQQAFRTDTFLTFTHNDVIGVELGGAIKNIIAIAAGISDGLGFGLDSRAALITRGLYEMIKIGKALGANPFTFTGLSGMGDLILTCTSTTSRNYTLGLQIGQGKKLKDILKKMKMVAEGVKTTEAIYKVIERHHIVAPICKEMYNMLYKGKSPKEAADDLTKMELHGELRTILT